MNLQEQVSRIKSMMKDETSIKVHKFKDYTLILSKNPCDIFNYFDVEKLHGLNYKSCLSHKNTKDDAYLSGLTNIIPETKKYFLFINTSRLGKGKEKMGLIMHETTHLSLLLYKYDVEKKEEEIITWAEKEAYKIFDLIYKK